MYRGGCQREKKGSARSQHQGEDRWRVMDGQRNSFHARKGRVVSSDCMAAINSTYINISKCMWSSISRPYAFLPTLSLSTRSVSSASPL